MAFTGSNGPNGGLGGSPLNTSSKAWFPSRSDSSTSRASLRQEAPSPRSRNRAGGSSNGAYWPSWWVLVAVAVLLAVIAAFSLAMLGAHDDGMARCERSNIKLAGPKTPAEQHVDYEIEAGYVKGHYELTAHGKVTLAKSTFMLKNLAATGHACTVLGGLVCAFAIVSGLSALALLAPLVKWGVLVAFQPRAREEMPRQAKNCLGPYLWPTAFINMLALLAMLIAFYIVVAVAVAQTTNARTQHVSPGAAWKCVPHPSWAWWLGVVASFAWMILTFLGWHEGRSQRLGITMSTAAHTMQRPPYSL
ncbi:hypothetical protein CVIRNUC_003715 [Coccomyxa viridis]|uniref:Uncharacterized protein n=1 Tax=Coccomyxa viridis TaxID=1274662 RepID=A0AAV1I2E3_9CHLO|nr:hypothetical protein CVIRNUC_003715 [Coccomyxa viridis]